MRLIISFIFIFFITSVYSGNQLKGLEEKWGDSVITTKIKAKFTKDKNLNPLKISISTKQGIVTLRGYVNNRQAFVDALKQAKDTKGVRSVNVSHLTVKQVNSSFTDAYITAKVEALILKAKVFDDESIPLVGINATTSNGVVTLTGHVKQKKSIEVIVKYVKRIHGVKRVIMKISIASPKNNSKHPRK